MGFNTGDLVTHIYRKDLAKMVSDGFTVSPIITYLCIRCVWYMGGFKEIYLKYKSSGYQYVGFYDSCMDQKSNFLHARHFSLVFPLLKLYRKIMLRGGWIDG